MKFFIIYVKSFQSIYDLAVQQYGSVDHVDTLLADNPTIDLDNDLAVVTAINIRQEISVLDEATKKFFTDSKTELATWENDGVSPGYTPGSGTCASGTVNIKDSAGTIIHVKIVASGAIAEQVISDSTVNVKDSAGALLYAKIVKAEATADQTVTDGSIILQNEHGDVLTTYTNKAQEAKVVQLPIIYIHPANSGHGTTTFLIGDEGWNEANRPRPAVPLIGIPALLDPTNPRKLLYKNIYNHLNRFVGINGGYYDYDLGTFHLADGTLSDEATVFGTTAANTSYMWDTHTQIGRKWNVQGSTNWSAHVATIHALTHAGFSDYFLGSRKQHESWLAGYDLSVGITSIKPINSNNSCKTSTPTFGSETTHHHQINGSTTSSTRSDATADSTFAFRWHTL